MCTSVSEVKMSARTKLRLARTARGACGILALLLGGCTVGPKYAKPPVATPAAYKELATPDRAQAEQWKSAQPGDAASRGKWAHPQSVGPVTTHTTQAMDAMALFMTRYLTGLRNPLDAIPRQTVDALLCETL